MKQFMTVSAFFLSAACLCTHTPSFASSGGNGLMEIFAGAQKASSNLPNGATHHRKTMQSPREESGSRQQLLTNDEGASYMTEGNLPKQESSQALRTEGYQGTSNTQETQSVPDNPQIKQEVTDNQGSTGPQGAQGPEGIQGQQGVQGSQGAQGKQGLPAEPQPFAPDAGTATVPSSNAIAPPPPSYNQ